MVNSVADRFQLWRVAALILSCLLLSSCLLISGKQESTDLGADAGNTRVSFVSAEGSTERLLETGSAGNLNVIVLVAVDQGELKVDILGPNGEVALSMQSRPGQQMTRTGQVTTDAEGRLRLRVVAQGARNGRYELLYQRV